MRDFNPVIFARIIHVIGVVIWIGGVAFVTTILIPSIKSLADQRQKAVMFELLEEKFSTQAKYVTMITGLSGFYMLENMDGWNRYLDSSFWWIHLMTLVWLVFTIVLFVLEPLYLHQWFKRRSTVDPDGTFKLIHKMHILLLSLSLLAIVGAVAGVRGYLIFS